MQDFISLVLAPASSKEPAGADRPGRSRDRATAGDETDAGSTFNLLLALAALNQQPEPQPAPETTVPLVPVGEADAIDAPAIEQAPKLTTWRARLDPPQPEPALPGFPAEDRLRSSFSGYTPTKTNAANPPRVPLTAENAGDHLPVSMRRAESAGADNSALADQSPITSLAFRQGHARRQLTPVSTESRSAAAATAPALTIIARNDRPVEPEDGTQQVNLRVIHPDGSVSRPRPNSDLLDRLADTWRDGFSIDADPSAAATFEAGQPGETSLGNERDRGSSDTNSGISRGATVLPLFSEAVTAEPAREAAPADMPVTPGQATNEIAGETHRLERAGGSELSFTMKLAPEHLGEIEIDIRRVDDRWSVTITASGDAARDALAAEIHRLEHAFHDRDMALESIRIATRETEPAINAPQAPDQAPRGDWLGNHARQFGSQHDSDPNGWQSTRENGTMRENSDTKARSDMQSISRRASDSGSGIDIRA